jgi:single-stranded-DNA-specific exonuclease
MKLELALESEPRRRLKAIFFGRAEALPPQAVLAYRLQREEYQGLAGVCLHVEHVLSELAVPAR